MVRALTLTSTPTPLTPLNSSSVIDSKNSKVEKMHNSACTTCGQPLNETVPSDIASKSVMFSRLPHPQHSTSFVTHTTDTTNPQPITTMDRLPDVDDSDNIVDNERYHHDVKTKLSLSRDTTTITSTRKRTSIGVSSTTTRCSDKRHMSSTATSPIAVARCCMLAATVIAAAKSIHTRSAPLLQPLRSLLRRNSRSSTINKQSLDDNSEKMESVTVPTLPQTLVTVMPCESCGSKLLKFLLSIVYALFVVWGTAFALVLTHERVPDVRRYPPLPDIFLDNIPRVPYAWTMVDWFVIGMSLLLLAVVFFHAKGFVIWRRFVFVTCTCFILRSVSMYITSLSPPSTHLNCSPFGFNTWQQVLDRAAHIASGMGMSINGVTICGDYMFSGHTVILTQLNYFTQEYAPRSRIWNIIRVVMWILNFVGMILILASHEHYSVDVFIAFYIASRLFIRYHAMINTAPLYRVYGDKIKNYEAVDGWFPFVTWFEKYDGRIIFEYEPPWTSITKAVTWLCQRAT